MAQEVNLSPHMSEIIFTLTCNWYLAGLCITGWKWFSFRILKMLLQSSISSFATEKSAVICIRLFFFGGGQVVGRGLFISGTLFFIPVLWNYPVVCLSVGTFFIYFTGHSTDPTHRENYVLQVWKVFLFWFLPLHSLELWGGFYMTWIYSLIILPFFSDFPLFVLSLTDILNCTF